MIESLWRASWQGGLFLSLALVFWVWAPRKRGGVVPAGLRYWVLWIGIVQLPLRLLVAVPVAVPSAKPATVSAPQHALDLGLAPVSRTERPASPSAEAASTDSVLPSAVRAVAPAPTYVVPAPVVPPRRLDASAWIARLYLAGLLACLMGQAARVWRSIRLRRGARPVSDRRAVAMLKETSDSGPKSFLLESGDAPCALLVGLVRPAIVLPAASWRNLSDEELRMTLAHELAHHRRRDLWLEVPVTLAKSLFYFHPLAWIAHREMTLASEEVCDAQALSTTRGSRSTYAKLLVRSAQGPANAMAMGSSLGYVLLQRRLEMLKGNPNLSSLNRFRLVSALIAATAVSAPVMLVHAQTAGPTAPVSLGAHRVSVHRLVQTTKQIRQQALKTKLTMARKSGRAQSLAAPVAPVAGSTPNILPASVAAVRSVSQTVRQDGWDAANKEPFLTVHFSSMPLRNALVKLFEVAGVDYSINSDVEQDTVSCSIHHATLLSALRTVLASVRQPLTGRIERGTVYVSARSYPAGGLMPPPAMRPPTEAFPPPSAVGASGGLLPPSPTQPGAGVPIAPPSMAVELEVRISPASVQHPMDRMVTSLEAQTIDVRALVRALCKRANMSYTIDPLVQGPVTLSLKNVSFQSALENILRQVDSTYRMDAEGVIQVIRRQD